MAKEIIKENHPLNDVPAHAVFPILKPISMCLPGRKVDERLKEPLLDEDQTSAG